MTALVRSTSPQHPSDLIGEWPEQGTPGIDAAVERSRSALPGWSAIPAPERAHALDLAAERLEAGGGELAALVVREVGKPVCEAVAEVARAVAILRYYAQAALDPEGEVFPAGDGRSWLFTRRRPRGVVGLITPWNFPVAIPTWKVAPALAWGNTVILKPAPEATACALRLASAFDLPEGVLQIVTGGAEAGRRLPRHPGIDAVSFTGSVRAGHDVASAAASFGVAFQAEMGGHNASIVLADADIEFAAQTIVGAAMGYAGQKCTATRRIITVSGGLAVNDALVESIRALPVGDPADESTIVGPVITEGARRRVLDAVAAASATGARLIVGGQPLARDGWYVAPTLLDRVAPDSELAQEEVFGPICAVLEASDEDEAVRIANGTRYGLVAAVFTNDLERAMDLAARLEVGMTRINAPTTGVDFFAPFGGWKSSGHGPREQGRAAREFYTKTNTLTVSPGSRLGAPR
ncbi:MAG: aldehyde dehydrogenase family protein [Acidimicrobiales bacterium]